MPYYAQLNGGTVVAVTETHSALAASADLVDIDGLHADLLGKTYDRTTGEFVDPAPPPPPPPAVWEWYIDHGPFTDRLGAAAVAIDLSTEPSLIAVRADMARRKWIDLKDPRTIAAVRYLAGSPHPVLGTLTTPLITQEVAAATLTTKPAPEENLALRKLYFS